MDTEGGREGGMSWEIEVDIYTLVILMIKEPTVPLTELCSVLCGHLNRKEIQKRGRYIYIYTFS